MIRGKLKNPGTTHRLFCQVVQDVTGDEFVAFMKILSPLKTMNTLQGRQQLIEIVTEQADLKQPFEVGSSFNKGMFP